MQKTSTNALKNVDLIIESRWVATSNAAQPLLENVAVVVNNSQIIEIMPIDQARLLYSASSITCLDEHVLIAGLINLHTHAAMSLMRGMADDQPLMAWLNETIWPAERALLSEKYVRDASLLACAEMLSGGITCFNDMYFYPNATASAVNQTGMRANLGLVVIDFPTSYANDAHDCLQKGFEARDHWHDNALLTTSIAPHAPYTVSNKTFETVLTYADQLALTIHTHCHETQDEIKQSEAQFGKRPLQRLQELGLLGPNFIAAHAVHCLPQELDLLKEYGCHIAHCPTSNLKLGSGIAPIATMIAKGLNVGLGSDGVASNNRNDIFAEMRLAALLAKGTNQDATLIPAQQALEMATINAAKALGLDSKIGSIEIGKCADFTAVKLTDFAISPYYEPISHLVYACGREHVTHTWVAGKLCYVEGAYANIEPVELKTIIATWQPKLKQIKLEQLKK